MATYTHSFPSESEDGGNVVFAEGYYSVLYFNKTFSSNDGARVHQGVRYVIGRIAMSSSTHWFVEEVFTGKTVIVAVSDLVSPSDLLSINDVCILSPEDEDERNVSTEKLTMLYREIWMTKMMQEKNNSNNDIKLSDLPEYMYFNS